MAISLLRCIFVIQLAFCYKMVNGATINYAQRSFIRSDSTSLYGSNGHMSGVLPSGDVVVVVSTPTGCRLALCPLSNCANSSFIRIGPTLRTEYCQLEHSDTLGSGGIIFVTAAVRNGLILASINVTSISNISTLGYTSVAAEATRGAAMFRQHATPYAVVPCNRRLCMYTCQDINCRAVSSTTAPHNLTSTSLIIRGAVHSRSVPALYLLFHDSLDNRTAIIFSCNTGNLSTCDSGAWRNLTASNSFDFRQYGFFSAPSVTYGHKNIQIDLETGLVWFSLHTNLKSIFYRCIDTQCNSTELVWSISQLSTMGALRQPDWTILKNETLVLIQPQLGVVGDDVIRSTTCFPLSSGRPCESYTIWRGKSFFGSTLSSRGSSVILSIGTAEAYGGTVMVSQMTPYCGLDEISSTETAGECIRCPPGSSRFNATLCVACDRSRGFSSTGGANRCLPCANTTSFDGACGRCASGTMLRNVSCSLCGSKSYSNPSSNDVCQSCPMNDITSPDSVHCLPGDSLVAAISCTASRDGARSANCIGDSVRRNSESIVAGAQCQRSKCVCIEGWRWFAGLCYPPESTNGLCTPRPPRIEEPFVPRVKKSDLLISGVYEIEISLPLETHSRYGIAGDVRVLSTEIKWIGANHQACDYPYGSNTPFFSKGTTYPQCEEIIGAYWYLDQMLRCPWNGRFDTVTPTITRIAYLNVTRYYEVFDAATGRLTTESKSSIISIQSVTKNPLINAAPVYQDESFYDNVGETIPTYLAAMLGVVGFIALLAIAAVIGVVIWRRKLMSKASKKSPPTAPKTEAATKSPEIEAAAPAPVEATPQAPPKRQRKKVENSESSESLPSDSAAKDHQDRSATSEDNSAAPQASPEVEQSSKSISHHSIGSHEVSSHRRSIGSSEDSEDPVDESVSDSYHSDGVPDVAQSHSESTADESSDTTIDDDNNDHGSLSVIASFSTSRSASDDEAAHVDDDDSGEIQFSNS